MPEAMKSSMEGEMIRMPDNAWIRSTLAETAAKLQHKRQGKLGQIAKAGILDI
jgi:hypothetical protein